MINFKNFLLFLIALLCIFAGDFMILFIGFWINIPLYISYFFGGIWSIIVSWAFTKGKENDI